MWRLQAATALALADIGLPQRNSDTTGTVAVDWLSFNSVTAASGNGPRVGVHGGTQGACACACVCAAVCGCGCVSGCGCACVTHITLDARCTRQRRTSVAASTRPRSLHRRVPFAACWLVAKAWTPCAGRGSKQAPRVRVCCVLCVACCVSCVVCRVLCVVCCVLCVCCSLYADAARLDAQPLLWPPVTVAERGCRAPRC